MNNSTEIKVKDPNSTFDDFERNSICVCNRYNRETYRYAKKHGISNEKAFEILYGKNKNKRGK